MSVPAPGRRRGLWIVLAALTCPCHLPVYALVFSGTAMGAVLAANTLLAALALGTVFLLALYLFFRRA